MNVRMGEGRGTYLCALPDLPYDEQRGADGDHGVGEEERGNVPSSREEYLVATDDRHDGGADESVVSERVAWMSNQIWDGGK